MNYNGLSDFTFDNIGDFLKENADAIIVLDYPNKEYKCLSIRGFIADCIPDSGNYWDLAEKLFFHINNSGARIAKEYKVFLPTFGIFKTKYATRIKIIHEETMHPMQLTIYPVENTGYSILVLLELDDDFCLNEKLTDSKVNTIQNTYLFSMYIDLVRDSTSSINITEISDESVIADISYTDWRNMIINMIRPEDQALFLKRTDPDYLRSHFPPGKTSSFDCMMRNLEGEYIWVKLIFSRSETKNVDDFRFVFMVQDINDNTRDLMSTLKKYEKMAAMDPLTGVFNHGRIETEVANVIEDCTQTHDYAAMMMLDIDYFKNVNDIYGHHVGDETLKHFAQILSNYMNEKNGVVGRWGGEEFVIVCYGYDLEQVCAMAEDLRKAVNSEKFADVGSITCSIGITMLTAADTINEAFDRMDKALYRAKDEGRNRVIA